MATEHILSLTKKRKKAGLNRSYDLARPVAQPLIPTEYESLGYGLRTSVRPLRAPAVHCRGNILQPLAMVWYHYEETKEGDAARADAPQYPKRRKKGQMRK
jgi:hypothetical protein